MIAKHDLGMECGADKVQSSTFTPHPTRDTHLDDLQISRALPIRQRRMVGPWCFLDRFGPLAFGDDKPMEVPPHPHIGLQTVSWLLEGEILHTDSLGSEVMLSPGGVNVMTAGKGIAHAEETPSTNSGKLNGVQLWAAMPDERRNSTPAFDFVEQVPIIETTGGLIKLFAGTYKGISSPAPVFSELIGSELQVHPQQTLNLVLDPQFEHALLLLDGDCDVEKMPLAKKTLYYLGTCRKSLDITSPIGCQVLLIGGLPFQEKILMWWNFVARTPEEIKQARVDWETHRRFGIVKATQLKRLPAPELTRLAHPNPIS